MASMAMLRRNELVCDVGERAARLRFRCEVREAVPRQVIAPSEVAAEGWGVGLNHRGTEDTGDTSVFSASLW